MNNKTYIFHVSGMHCNACVLMIESELGDMSNIVKVKTSLSHNLAEVTGDFGDQKPEFIASELSKVLIKHGYSLSLQKQKNKIRWSEFKIAIPIALLFITLFILLQKTGLVNLVGSGNINYGTVFLIGIIASLSSCMAVVGGLLLSMSATFAKKGDKVRPQLLFHGGRIASFFILGGVIGAISSAFTLSPNISFILGIFIAVVMLILGINLLDVFPWAKKLQPSMPKFIAKNAIGVNKMNHTFTPLLLGVITFFLPCGFTQSMQLYSLTTGSFLKGGLTMLAFALGTLPVLSLISFSSLSIKKSNKAGIFFKSAGLIVILFSLYNVITSLVAIGLISINLNF